MVLDEAGELCGEVVQRAFKGAEILFTIRVKPGLEVLSLIPSHHDYQIGDMVHLRLELDHMIVFPREGDSHKAPVSQAG